jgi:hypothetical protein
MIKTFKKNKLEQPITKSEYSLRYYHDNKERMLQYYKEIIICDICGSGISRVHIARHKLTKKCMNVIIPFRNEI